MIHIHQLDYAYSKGPKLFEQLSLKLEAGKIYSLLGKNGSGKSTLLKLLIGALLPQGGEINLEEYTPKDRKLAMLQDIYFLSERPVVPPISMQTFLQAYSPFYPQFDHNLFAELVALFGLDMGHKLHHLSLGESNKFLIAFGLATQAKFLFLDEPTQGLDVPSKAQFRKMLAKYVHESQTVILSTHQVRDLAQLIESLIILDQGKILLQKDISDIEAQLQFINSPQAEVESSLYAGRKAGGYIHILPNPTGEASDIDLELLFQAIIDPQQAVLSHLNTQSVQVN